MNKDYKLTILGLGNILLGDEGFGVHFVNYFQKKYHLPKNIAIVDGGTMGYRLLDVICRTECLLVIDAIKADDEPGAIYRFKADDIPHYIDHIFSIHEVEFLDLWLKTEMLGEAPKTIIIGICPSDFNRLSLKLNKSMEEVIPRVEELVKKEIESLGLKINNSSHNPKLINNA